MSGYLAGYPDRAGYSTDVVVVFQLVWEKGYFSQAGRILQCYKPHHFAVIGSCPAGCGDKTRYCDLPVYKPVQSGSCYVFDAEQYRRMYA